MFSLSRILHRSSSAAPAVDVSREAVRQIRALIKPQQLMGVPELNAFLKVFETLKDQPDSETVTKKVLHDLAFSNTNTSYIEPFVNAAFQYNHPQKQELGKMYSEFVANNDSSWLVSKMLDDRFYASSSFPVYAFGLLGQAGVTVPEHAQSRWIHRALLSETPVDQIRASAAAMRLDVNAVKDNEHRTILHTLMADSLYDHNRHLEHIFSRAKQLGIERTQDIFGRYPEEFGRPADVLVFAKSYTVSNQEPLNALRDYLTNTLHQFSGLHDVRPYNTEIYLKDNGLLSAFDQKTTLFEHVLASNDKTIVAEFNSLVIPKVQHSDTTVTLPYVFLAKYVCSPAGQSDKTLVNDLFAMFQQTSPKELSTALGSLLMRSNGYCVNHDVDIHQLANYAPAIANIMEYQQQKGLTNLLVLEKERLGTLKPTTPELSM